MQRSARLLKLEHARINSAKGIFSSISRAWSRVRCQLAKVMSQWWEILATVQSTAGWRRKLEPSCRGTGQRRLATDQQVDCPRDSVTTRIRNSLDIIQNDVCKRFFLPLGICSPPPPRPVPRISKFNSGNHPFPIQHMWQGEVSDTQ